MFCRNWICGKKWDIFSGSVKQIFLPGQQYTSQWFGSSVQFTNSITTFTHIYFWGVTGRGTRTLGGIYRPFHCYPNWFACFNIALKLHYPFLFHLSLFFLHIYVPMSWTESVETTACSMASYLTVDESFSCTFLSSLPKYSVVTATPV